MAMAYPEFLIIIFIPLLIAGLLKADIIASTLHKLCRGRRTRDLKVSPPWHNRSLGWMLSNLVAPGIILLPLSLLAISGKASEMPYIGLGSFVIASLLRGLGNALSRETADPVANDDARAPIVYLREFSGEGTLSQIGRIINTFNEPDFEEHLQQVLAPIGPFVALGKPALLQKGGASRKYVGAGWLEEISRLIDRSRLVVIQLGNSPNLLLEMREVVKRKNPESILIYLKPKGGHFSISSFRAAASALRFPSSEELENGMFLWFNSEGDPIVLRASGKRSPLTIKQTPKLRFEIETSLVPVIRYFTETGVDTLGFSGTPNSGPQADR